MLLEKENYLTEISFKANNSNIFFPIISSILRTHGVQKEGDAGFYDVSPNINHTDFLDASLHLITSCLLYTSPSPRDA